MSALIASSLSRFSRPSAFPRKAGLVERRAGPHPAARGRSDTDRENAKDSGTVLDYVIQTRCLQNASSSPYAAPSRGIEGRRIEGCPVTRHSTRSWYSPFPDSTSRANRTPCQDRLLPRKRLRLIAGVRSAGEKEPGVRRAPALRPAGARLIRRHGPARPIARGSDCLFERPSRA